MTHFIKIFTENDTRGFDFDILYTYMFTSILRGKKSAAKNSAKIGQVDDFRFLVEFVPQVLLNNLLKFFGGGALETL